jgi:hypothetical protein
LGGDRKRSSNLFEAGWVKDRRHPLARESVVVENQSKCSLEEGVTAVARPS